MEVYSHGIPLQYAAANSLLNTNFLNISAFNNSNNNNNGSSYNAEEIASCSGSFALNDRSNTSAEFNSQQQQQQQLTYFEREKFATADMTTSTTFSVKNSSVIGSAAATATMLLPSSSSSSVALNTQNFFATTINALENCAASSSNSLLYFPPPYAAGVDALLNQQQQHLSRYCTGGLATAAAADASTMLDSTTPVVEPTKNDDILLFSTCISASSSIQPSSLSLSLPMSSATVASVSSLPYASNNSNNSFFQNNSENFQNPKFDFSNHLYPPSSTISDKAFQGGENNTVNNTVILNELDALNTVMQPELNGEEFSKPFGKISQLNFSPNNSSTRQSCKNADTVKSTTSTTTLTAERNENYDEFRKTSKKHSTRALKNIRKKRTTVTLHYENANGTLANREKHNNLIDSSVCFLDSNPFFDRINKNDKKDSVNSPPKNANPNNELNDSKKTVNNDRYGNKRADHDSTAKMVQYRLETGANHCHACDAVIEDRIILFVDDHIYHAECLKCSACDAELQSYDSCFVKSNTLYCKACYEQKYQNKCTACDRHIQSTDWVRKARDALYHLACFACEHCKRQLSTGEQFSQQDGRLLCKQHYMELVHGEDSNVKQKAKRVRTTFADEQLNILQAHFHIDCNPDGSDLERIANLTGLSKRVTQVWFQNSRARQKKHQVAKKSPDDDGITNINGLGGGMCALMDEQSSMTNSGRSSIFTNSMDVDSSRAASCTDTYCDNSNAAAVAVNDGNCASGSLVDEEDALIFPRSVTIRTDDITSGTEGANGEKFSLASRSSL